MEPRDIDVMNVCRLCLGTENLIWVFDKRFGIPQNMKDVIHVTTGVIISSTDNVSQMLCNKCLTITIKMFKFRSSSIVNDIELKTTAARSLNPPMHESIAALLNEYPKVVLPSSITKINISPSVKVNKNEVTVWMEDYRRKRKIEKKKKKQLKLASEKLRQNEKMVMDMDIEGKISIHVIENKSSSATLIQEESSHEVRSVTPEIPILDQPTVLVQDESDPNHTSPVGPNDVLSGHEDNVSECGSVESTSKRKLSASPSGPVKKFKSLPDNRDIGDHSESLVTLKYCTKSLFICDICNSILYSAKDLKKHKMKHNRCILCKKVFRNLQETTQHSENSCEIKQIMNNLPTVYLQRCDKLEEIRNKYPSAFGLGPTKDIETIVLNSSPPSPPKLIEATSHDPLEITTLVKQLPPSPEQSTKAPVEIYLISDDEDEPDNSSKTETTNSASTEKITKNADSNETTAKVTSVKKTKKVPITKDTAIKPDIEIVGENIFDVNLDDTDINLLKNILRRTRKNVRETSIQTDLPCNADIVSSLNKDKLFELKNLRKYLNYYKIPVNVWYSPQYSVRYGYDPSPFMKKDRCWSKVNMKPKTAPVNNNKVPSTNKNLNTATTTGAQTSTPRTDVANLIENLPKVTPNVTNKLTASHSVPPFYLVKKTSNTSVPLTTTSVITSSVITPVTSNTFNNVSTNNSSNVINYSIPMNSVPSTNYNPTNQNIYSESSISKPNPQTPYPVILNYRQKPASPQPVLPSTTPYQMPPPNYVILNGNLNLQNTTNLSKSNNISPLLNGHILPPSTVNHTLSTPNNLCQTENGVLPDVIPPANQIMPPPARHTLPQPAKRVMAPPVIGRMPPPALGSMPPPTNTFVPQRPGGTTITYHNSVITQDASQYTAPSTSALNLNSNFVPMIRVRNVSELK